MKIFNEKKSKHESEESLSTDSNIPEIGKDQDTRESKMKKISAKIKSFLKAVNPLP